MIHILTKTVDVEIEPADVAKIFCDMDSEQQAIFFNEVAKHVKTWQGPFPMQMQYLTNEKGLTDDARRIMESIGEYAWKDNYHG